MLMYFSCTENTIHNTVNISFYVVGCWLCDSKYVTKHLKFTKQGKRRAKMAVPELHTSYIPRVSIHMPHTYYTEQSVNMLAF